MAATSTSVDTPPLGKYLASTDKKTRDKAIKNLSIFLSDPARNDLPSSEIAKLWKGIFYCFWMSDKPLVQQALAAEIAELLLTISRTSSSLSFLRGFWHTIVREWNGIDRLRIDKYYMLVRRIVNASFRLLLRTEWDESCCEEYNHILTDQGGPLCPDDIKVPTSLAYHLADVYLEELDKALSNPPTPSPLPAPLAILLSPFFTLAARTSSNTTYQRIESTLLDPLFFTLTPIHDHEPPSGKRAKLSIPTYDALISNSCSTNPKTEGALEKAQLREPLLQRMFDVASKPDSRDSNRRKLYKLWKEYTDENNDVHINTS